MEHDTNHEPTEEEWGEFSRQANKEKDPDKTSELGERIEKFDEAQRHKGPQPH
jgi:hypothetical protein